MRFQRRMAYVLVLLCFTTVAAQATTCGAEVQQALAAVQQGCAATGRNQACYGNISLQATPRSGVTDFTFAKTGDLANVADIDTLKLSALDTAADTWGIALMKLQANLPDTLPGENVTFLLFGDVQITNAVTPGASVQVTANGAVNIRSTPSTSAQVLGQLSKGDTVSADGRNADSTWLRIEIPNSGAPGWVYTSLFTPAGDLGTLSAVDPTQPVYAPMQAFYFQTGIAQTNCEQAPQDGILIQTPQGAGQIDLRADDVDIQLGSTAFLQAQPNGAMTVSVVEGEGHITAEGTTVAVPAGAQVTIPVDQNLKAKGAPDAPQPYDAALMQPLPIQELPEPITVAPPASEAQITAANLPPTPTRSAASVNLPGAIGNVGSLNSMSETAFCQYMSLDFLQTATAKAQYIAQLEATEANVPPDVKAQLDQLIARLNQCP